MNTLVVIILMAILTYLVRALPMILIKKPIKSIFIKSVLHYIPYAILATMTVPYIFYANDNLVSTIVGTVVAIVLAWFGRGLVTVSVLAVLSAYAIEILVYK